MSNTRAGPFFGRGEGFAPACALTVSAILVCRFFPVGDRQDLWAEEMMTRTKDDTGRRFSGPPALEAWQLSLLASVFIVAANNYRLVGSVTQELDIATTQGLGFMLTLCALMTAILTVFFLCIAPRVLLKAAIVLLICVSAILGYFTQSLGVVFGPEMFANIVATFVDRNMAEATELISFNLLWHLFLFAALPAALVLKTPVVANLRNNPDTKSAWYSDHGYYDDAMVGELQRITEDAAGDQLIVLHTIGSHGPAYSRRYPHGFAMFTPYCSDKSPLNCTSAKVNNAYDNTILYTDHFLDELITLLQSHAGDFDSFLLYASDHGESLGEKGVYLHGLPYDIAPDAQKKVPFIAWFSGGYTAHHDVDPSPELEGEDLSHDFLPHSLLGLFEVQTSVYRRDHDVFRPAG